MVIGTPDVDEVRAEVDHAARELGHDVDVSVLTQNEWESNQTGFVTHLRSEPLVELNVADRRVTPAKRPKRPAGRRVKAAGMVSDLVAEQRG